MVVPASRSTHFSSARISSRSSASRLDSGSSISSTAGSTASARATATRWRWPPESCAGIAVEIAARYAAAPPPLDLALDARGVGAGMRRPKRDVVAHRHVREHRVVLEHHGEPALARRQVGDVAPADQHAAGALRLQPGDDAQQRGLAAARRPEQRHELAVGDVELTLSQRRHRAERLARRRR